MLTLALALSAAAFPTAAGAADGAKKKPKYYFKIAEITGDVPETTRTLARDLVAAELEARPEFTGADEPSASKPRKLRAFEVSLKFARVSQELKPPRVGGKLKQLETTVNLLLVGAEIPSKKLAFSGNGESVQLAEVFETRLEQETQTLLKDGVTDAIRQAVEQALLKLSLPVSQPVGAKVKGRARAKPAPGSKAP